MEIPDDDTMEALLSGEMVFRGTTDNGGTGKCLACTSSQSFEVMQKEVSNKMLMIPPERMRERYTGNVTERAVEGGGSENEPSGGAGLLLATHMIGNVLELVRTRMDTDRLLRAIRSRMYVPEMEAGGRWVGDDGCDAGDIAVFPRAFTESEVVHHAQASVGETLSFLRGCEEAIEVDSGRWLGIDLSVVQRALDLLLLCCEEKGWEPCGSCREKALLREAEVVEAMCTAEHGEHVTRYLLRKFGKIDTEGSQGGAGDTLWLLEADKIATFRAVCILEEKPACPYEDFIEAWQASCMQTSPPLLESSVNPLLTVSLLRGEALLAVGTAPSVAAAPGPDAVVHRLRAAQLSSAPSARFEALFAFRSSWLWEDLEPYIHGIGNPQDTVDSLLLKYTRKVKDRETDATHFTKR